MVKKGQRIDFFGDFVCFSLKLNVELYCIHNGIASPRIVLKT